MRHRLTGVVDEISAERPGIQELRVRTDSGPRTAVNYTPLTGRVSVGDSVTLNVCAVNLGLGTGGIDFVTAVESGSQPDSSDGHIIKLRYTPYQLPVLAAESPESPHHEAVRGFDSLGGTPVVCAELHGQIAAVAAAVKWETRGKARIAYVHTDGGALPLAFSRSVWETKERGLIEATITSGQSFGGDYEAINTHSALAIAHSVVGADVIVVGQGPGAAGTDTPLGFSGIEQGEALNAAASLGGTPVAVVRMSEADPRPRHLGISHHTITVLQRVALCRALVPVPRPTSDSVASWRGIFEGTGIAERHDVVTVDVGPAMESLAEHGPIFSTMGRSVEDDRTFFEAAVAAGLVAGQLFTGEHR